MSDPKAMTAEELKHAIIHAQRSHNLNIRSDDYNALWAELLGRLQPQTSNSSPGQTRPAEQLAQMKHSDFYTWRKKTLPDDSIQVVSWADLAPAERKRKIEEAQWYLNALAGQTDVPQMGQPDDDELQRLRDWKESAMHLLPMQEWGQLLGLPLGSDIHSHITPALQRLKALEPLARGRQMGIAEQADKLHIAICLAVSWLNQGETLNAHNVLREALVKYADAETSPTSPAQPRFTCQAAEFGRQCDFCEGGDVPLQDEHKHYYHVTKAAQPANQEERK